ncbi:hypothetical protein BG011_005210 [Mortierella polycephala]|uniref:Uncharacterized protein n=1 Tax=Mortierella polycephala TaxID=41804 RepID=A0A9P6U1M1_9FUNG|nr:hypothetical protein BG011_005210 [Mortierella polycephala]
MTLALTVSGALTAQERAEIELKEGSRANFCPPCLQKAMHNHFPHACAPDLDSDAANHRVEGSTPQEERCVCVSFQDLSWMKADCSKECDYVHSEQNMKFFLPSEKIEGCDKWIDFATGKEKDVEGFTPKNEDHKPEVFPIVDPPPKAEGEKVEEEGETDERAYKVSVKVTTAEDDAKKQLELESGLKDEIKGSDKKDETKAETKDEL